MNSYEKCEYIIRRTYQDTGTAQQNAQVLL